MPQSQPQLPVVQVMDDKVDQLPYTLGGAGRGAVPEGSAAHAGFEAVSPHVALNFEALDRERWKSRPAAHEERTWARMLCATAVAPVRS